ncbi:MAG: GAF domain-containing protein [Acidimicrobiia bacterium]|nr:GAF domain-containing protein [Acidimicrobiia bacterium]
MAPAQSRSLLSVPDQSRVVFDGLFESAPDAMIATDTRGIIVRANTCAGLLFSFRPSDMRGMSMEQLLAERFRKEYLAHRRALLEGGAPTAPELEVYGLTANGNEVPIDAAVGRFETGGTTYVLMVIREVTDRVATQENLERRLALDAVVVSILGRLNAPTLEEIDQQIHQSLADLCEFAQADRSYIFEKSENGTTMSNTYEWCSPGTESRIDMYRDIPLATFPWISAQIDQGRVVQIPSVDDLPPEARVEQDRFRRQGIRSVVNVPMIAGGRVVGLIGFEAVHSQAMRWPADEISTFMVLQDFFANALRRQQVGMELQRTNRMLQAVTECNDALVRAEDEDALLRDVCRIVVESGGYRMAWVGVAMHDKERSIRPIAQWGLDEGYMAGLTASWADNEHGAGPSGTAVRMRSPVAVQNVAMDPGFELWRERALKRGYKSVISVPLIHSNEVLGVLAVYAAEVAAFDEREIGILKRFADDLAYGIGALRARQRQQEAEAQLRETLRSKDEFVATIAHELRTPLTAVVGFAQVLRDGGSDLPSEERAEMIRMIADEGVDLTNIVDDLLVAAKAEAGTLTVSRVPVDLRAQAAQVLEGWGADAAGRIEFIGPSVHTVGDPVRVRQILRNLVSNAFRYGGERIRVSVSSDHSTGRVAVADNGTGVSTEDQETIFEPYRRAHNAPGLTASMGLGLTISRQLARLMDGDLTYFREAGDSIFALTLPRASG